MKQLEKYGGKVFFYNLCRPRFLYWRGMYPQQWDMSIGNVTFSLMFNVNQSDFSSLDWEITSQSKLDWVACKRYWEFPINTKIFLIPIHPLHFNTLTLTHCIPTKKSKWKTCGNKNSCCLLISPNVQIANKIY